MVVIEHNLDVIKTADYVIDIGPDGRRRRGRIMAAGTPEEVAAHRGPTPGASWRDLPRVRGRPARGPLTSGA